MTPWVAKSLQCNLTLQYQGLTCKSETIEKVEYHHLGQRDYNILRPLVELRVYNSQIV